MPVSPYVQYTEYSPIPLFLLEGTLVKR
jgi:hypothetical protein